LASLSLLALNDHVLKGAGWLPEALTGKLSDVAGMLVAPSLLAALTGTKTTRGLLACHAAIAAVFAGINVSHGFANLWSGAMGLVGMPWSITTDPTDLLVLPLMPLCWALTVPAMRRGYRAWHDTASVGPAARYAAAGLGAFACIATSPPDEQWDGELTYSPITADVYVHNTDDTQNLTLRVRPLADGVALDCFEVAQDPSALLLEPVFGEAFTWTLPPGTTAALEPNEPVVSRSCHAALIESDGFDSAVVFWDGVDIPRTSVPGAIDDISEYNRGAIAATPTEDGGTFTAAVHSNLVFELNSAPEEVLPNCERIDPGNRVAYSPAPSGTRKLFSVETGLDGCFDLRVGGLEDSEPSVNPFYLCLPEVEFPFIPGDVLKITQGGSAAGVLSLELEARDGVSVEPGAEISLNIAHSRASYSFLGLQTSGVFAFGCDPIGEDECGTAARRVNVQARLAGGDAMTLQTGAPNQLSGAGGETAEVFVTYAEDFVVTHTDCYPGSLATGTDIEFVAVIRGPLAP